MAERSFTPALFAFMRELREHNDRDWFKANKQRYEEDVREPAFAFISEFAGHLQEVAPHFVADPSPTGGSLFRIYRDTRFSKDKTPYKTHTGIHFRHEKAKDVHAPGFYLHLEPRNVFAAAGIWRPETGHAGPDPGRDRPQAGGVDGRGPGHRARRGRPAQATTGRLRPRPPADRRPQAQGTSSPSSS